MELSGETSKNDNLVTSSCRSRIVVLVLAVLLWCPSDVSSSHNSNPFGTSRINVNNGPFEDSLFDDELGGPRPITTSSGGGGVVLPSMCLPNYEISEGSIIRTKDSVDLGARFLNESDLGMNGREECLALCCRTPYCNVAVFQEKSSGSCYMFDCGPPEDFRCKFTSQIQYMSGILRRKEIQTSSNVQSDNNPPHSSNSNAGSNGRGNNQHETELNQLRSRGDELLEKGMSKGNLAPIVSSRSEGNNVGGGAVPPTASSAIVPLLGPLDGVSHRCSRWQFECKSSGECIAIYNACDGIPNCEDGSDESPELHCPSVIGQAPPSTHVHPPSSQSDPASGGNNPSGHKSTGNEVNPGQRMGQSSGGKNSGNPLGGKGNSDHIFNHKGGGVMDQNYGGQLQQQQKHLNPFMKQGYDYPNGDQNSGYVGQNYLPNSPLSNTAYGGGPGSYNPYNNAGYQNPAMNLPQFNGQQPNLNLNNFQVPPILQQQQTYYGPPNNNVALNQASQQNQLFNPSASNNNGVSSAIGVKPGEIESANSQRLLQPKSDTTTLPKLDSQSKSNAVTSSPSIQNANSNGDKSSKEGVKIISTQIHGDAELEAENKLEDEILKNLKNQPYDEAATAAVHLDADELSPHKAGPGAVFLFIVGLGMSVVLAAIVGCRLRRLGAGARRRRKNRLDPDYLVDGMYL